MVKGGQRSFSLDTISYVNPRYVTTELEGEGLDAEFVSNGDSSKYYKTEKAEPVEHELVVAGNKTGKHVLNITTVDNSIDSNTTYQLPVYVEPRTDASSLPGLGLVQALAIFMASAIYALVLQS